MLKLINYWEGLSSKKKALFFLAAGMLCLFGCLALLLWTESVFSTVLLYFSLGLNICGLYLVLWVMERGDRKERK